MERVLPCPEPPALRSSLLSPAGLSVQLGPPEAWAGDSRRLPGLPGLQRVLGPGCCVLVNSSLFLG